MPTYKNDTNGAINLVFDDSSRINRVDVGEQVETEQIYTDAELVELGLTKIADTPFYNPLINVQDVVSDSTLQSEVNIYPLAEIIRIKPDVDITIYLNSMSNTPGYPIGANALVNLSSKRNIIKIYIVFSSSGICNIKELKD